MFLPGSPWNVWQYTVMSGSILPCLAVYCQFCPYIVMSGSILSRVGYLQGTLEPGSHKILELTGNHWRLFLNSLILSFSSIDIPLFRAKYQKMFRGFPRIEIFIPPWYCHVCYILSWLAVYCHVWQYIVMAGSILSCLAVYCHVWQYILMCGSILSWLAVYCHVWQYVYPLPDWQGSTSVCGSVTMGDGFIKRIYYVFIWLGSKLRGAWQDSFFFRLNCLLVNC